MGLLCPYQIFMSILYRTPKKKSITIWEENFMNRSEVMKRASELRKQGFSKSEALAKAWEEAKKATTVKTTTSETSEVKSEKAKAKKDTYLYDFKCIDDTRDYEIEHKVTCFNLNYWSTTYNWCSSILIMAKSREKAIKWARKKKDFIFENKDINIAQAHEVFPSKPCVKAF